MPVRDARFSREGSSARRRLWVAAAVAFVLATVVSTILANRPPDPRYRTVLAPASRLCAGETVRASGIEPRRLPAAMRGYLPTWLPAGFGLAGSWGKAGRLDGFLGSAIWTDGECRRVRVTLYPEPSPRAAENDWTFDAEAPPGCAERPNTAGCILQWHRHLGEVQLSVQMMALGRSEGQRIVDSIPA